jgi:hypothetical protein
MNQVPLNRLNDLPCVRVANIPMIANLQRHIDNVLMHLEDKIGTVKRVCIFRFGRDNTFLNNHTIGFIQLTDPNKHNELCFYLNATKFHDVQLEARLFKYSFIYMDDMYHPTGTECAECNTFKSKQHDSGTQTNVQCSMATSLPQQREHRERLPGTKDQLQCYKCSVCKFFVTNIQKMSHGRNNTICNHIFCSACINRLTVKSDDNNWRWDGFAMIDVSFRNKDDLSTVFSCVHCSAVQGTKE